MDIYLGNDLGAVVGPYGEDEIGSRLKGEAWLRSQGGNEIFAIRAAGMEQARTRLAAELRRRAGGYTTLT